MTLQTSTPNPDPDHPEDSDDEECINPIAIYNMFCLGNIFRSESSSRSRRIESVTKKFQNSNDCNNLLNPAEIDKLKQVMTSYDKAFLGMTSYDKF